MFTNCILVETPVQILHDIINISSSKSKHTRGFLQQKTVNLSHGKSLLKTLNEVFNWLTEHRCIGLDLKNMLPTQLNQCHQKLVA